MIQRAGEHMEKTREGVIGSKHGGEASSVVKEVKTGRKGEHTGRRVQEVNQNTGGGIGELSGRGKRR